MGAEVSKPVKKKTISPDWIFRSENELVAYFNDRAIQQCTAPELAAFRYNIRNADLGRVVDKRQIARLYQLPDSNSVLAAQFHRIIENLTAYPLLGQRRRGASYIGCLKAYVLLDPVRGTKYTELKAYDQAALFFMLLSVEPDEMSPDRQRLHGREIVENYNELDLEQLSIPGVEMLEFVSFLLLLSRYFARPNTKIEDMVYDELTKTYENQVMNIIRTMNPEIATQYDLETRDITLTQFTDAVKTVFPNLLQPLELFMEQIFYQKRNLVSSNKDLKGSFTTRLTSGALIAQIATYWPRELVYGKMQKLYIGRESGYSMRSFQSKVFKWMAPTMIILAGTRIHCDGEFAEDSQRYNRFIHEFPRFKDAQTELDPALKRKKKVMYVIYVNEPWKVTNKELFGDCETTIVQLSPVQEVFRAQSAPNMYFNTLGGGIGVGNVQPLIKGTKKKYYPGDVSLTIDPSMEFGVLRHVGQCGMFSPGMLWTQRGEEDKAFEIRFTIEDIEAWGYGGEGEANEQIRLWEWEEAEAQRRRNINLHSLDEDRALLQMAGLVGQHQSGGSM